MRFKLQVATQLVELETPSGAVQTLELREMLASQRDTYLTKMGSRVKFDAKGAIIGIGNVDGMQADLLCLCLYRDGKNIGKEEIQAWPSGVVSQLYTAAQEINHLNKTTEEAKAAAKKDSPENGEPGSTSPSTSTPQ